MNAHAYNHVAAETNGPRSALRAREVVNVDEPAPEFVVHEHVVINDEEIVGPLSPEVITLEEQEEPAAPTPSLAAECEDVPVREDVAIVAGRLGPVGAAEGVAAMVESGAARGGPTRFINGVRVVDRRASTVLEGTVDLKPTLDRIASGGRFSHRNDGSIFQNHPLPGRTLPELPAQTPGYYREYAHPTPVSPVLARSEWSSVRAARCSTRRTTTRRSFPCSERAP